MTGQNPIVALLVIVAISALPFVLVVATSFLKTFVVLTLLKNAFGNAEIPPTIIVFALAVLFTVVTMAPVAERVADKTAPLFKQAGDSALLSSQSLSKLRQFYRQAEGPYREFLAKHARRSDVALMASLGSPKRIVPSDVKRAPMLVLLPAFVLSELNGAFWFGFLLLLPFVLLDLFVAHVLTATGAVGLSAAVVSLPLKLLLFVSIGGWELLTRGLMLSYR